MRDTALLRTACSRNPYRHSYSAHFPDGKWLRTHVCTDIKAASPLTSKLDECFSLDILVSRKKVLVK